MSDAEQQPPPVWTPPASITELYASTAGNQFASINAPIAGARHEAVLPDGPEPVQLYSLGTPNGNKVSILFEELEDLGIGFSYGAHLVNIGKGDQFGSGFVAVNPNSKIPACVDKNGGEPITLFESAAIMIYFAEKHGQFYFSDDARLRQEALQWIFWQMAGLGPITGNFGHFFVYAPDEAVAARTYGVARYGMDVQRHLSVLENNLADGKEYLVGGVYSLADMAIFPWVHQVRTGYPHKSGIKAAEFLNVAQYPKLNQWADRILAREQVKRAITVCSWATPDKPKPWL